MVYFMKKIVLLTNKAVYDIFAIVYFPLGSCWFNSLTCNLLEFDMILEFRKVPIRRLQGIFYPFRCLLNLALKETTSEPRLISICFRRHLHLGEEGQVFLAFSHPLSDDSRFQRVPMKWGTLPFFNANILGRGASHLLNLSIPGSLQLSFYS